MRRFMRKNIDRGGSRRRLLAAALAMLVALLPRWAEADGKLVLGASLQLTGSAANLGRSFRDGYQIAIDRINEKGGVAIGEETYRLTGKFFDNQSDSNRNTQQYLELVTRDRVDFLLGPYSSGDTLAAAALAEKYRVLMVEAGGASNEIFRRGYRYVFGTATPAENYFASTIEMMGKLEPRPHRVALIAADDVFDSAVAEGAKRHLEKAGFALVLDRRYNEKKDDFGTLLAEVKTVAPDVILWGGYENAVLHFMREAKRLDLNPRGLTAVTIGASSASFRTTLGKDADFLFGMTPWMPSPLLRDRWFGDGAEFQKQFHRRFGYDPDYHVAAAVAAVETFAMALEAAGTAEVESVRAAIAASQFESLYAMIHFRPEGQIDLPQIVIQLQEGQIVPIYTDHFLNKPHYPVPAWRYRN